MSSFQEILASGLAEGAEKALAAVSAPTTDAEALRASEPLPKLQPFMVGALGNFPYFWQDPATLRFNSKTYSWISASLKAGADPIQPGEPFTNLFITALSKVSYSLSTADQAQLNRDQQNAINQQGALLLAWRNAFGSLPTAPQPPIDAIIQTITTEWASPPTTLTQLQKAPDLKSVLNRTPASGQPILVPLASYLNALNRGVSLLNASVMNNGYLHRALAAAQKPTQANGALLTTRAEWQPAFAVATSVAEILKGLSSQDGARSARFDMSVSRPTGGELSVRLAGRSRPVQTPADQLIEIKPRGARSRDGDLFLQSLAPGSGEISVGLRSPGVTMVYFGPSPFEQSTLRSWYWPFPITTAIRNGSQDVTGFKFSPRPQIDFTRNGPFGFLTGVAISRSPDVSIATQGASDSGFKRLFRAGTQVDVSFLGQRLSEGSAYVVSEPRQSSTGSLVELTPEASIAGNSLDSTAFVLGVQPEFPAAG